MAQLGMSKDRPEALPAYDEDYHQYPDIPPPSHATPTVLAPPSYDDSVTPVPEQTTRTQSQAHTRQRPTEAEQKILLSTLLKKHQWRTFWGPLPRTLSSALKTACRHGQAAFVDDLLAAGTEITHTGRFASTTKSCAIHEALRGPAPELAVRLLGSLAAVDGSASSQGDLLDARDEEGCTPLHLAASCGDQHVVAALLDMGAEVDSIDHPGRTPLFMASRYKRLETMRLLMSHGADVGRVKRSWKGQDAVLGRWEFVQAILYSTDEKAKEQSVLSDYASLRDKAPAGPSVAPAKQLALPSFDYSCAADSNVSRLSLPGSNPLESFYVEHRDSTRAGLFPKLADTADADVLPLARDLLADFRARHKMPTSTWQSEEYKTWLHGLEWLQKDTKKRGGEMYKDVPWED